MFFQRIVPTTILVAAFFLSSSPASASFTYLPPSEGGDLLALSTTQAETASFSMPPAGTMDPNAHILGQLVIPANSLQPLPATDVAVPNAYPAPSPEMTANEAPLMETVSFEPASAKQNTASNNQDDSAKCPKTDITDKVFSWLSDLSGGSKTEKQRRPCLPRTTAFNNIDKTY